MNFIYFSFNYVSFLVQVLLIVSFIMEQFVNSFNITAESLLITFMKFDDADELYLPIMDCRLGGCIEL